MSSTNTTPTASYVCNRNIDLNCDGKIESWEKADDIPRIVFGTFSMILWAHSLYTVLVNKWYQPDHTGFMFKSLFSAAGTLELIFSTIFSMPLMIMWWATYSNNLATIDAFYVYAFVNNWYLATIYWIVWFIYVVSVAIRNYGTMQGDSSDDHSLSVVITSSILGLSAIVMQTVWADRFNFWYVKTQFLAGRDINSAKNNVWNYPASLGSTARSWYNYTENRRDAQKPIQAAESERNA